MFLVCEAISSCHFSDSVRCWNTSLSLPLSSPAWVRLTVILSKALGCWVIACDSFLPPSMDFTRLAMISRNTGSSMLSRRSARHSSRGTPARVSCSRLNKKVIRSARLTFWRPNADSPSDSLASIRSSPLRLRCSSRSTRLAASCKPLELLPRLSIALYAYIAMMVSAHAVGEVYHARHLRQRGDTLQHALQAVLCEGAEAFFQRGVLQGSYAGAVRDQVVDVVVHLEDFHDRLAAAIALMAADVASGSAVQGDVRVGAYIQQLALAMVGSVGIFAVRTQHTD